MPPRGTPLHRQELFYAVTRAGLADDNALRALAISELGGPVSVRLALGRSGGTCHCCAGQGAQLVAVDSGDPSLSPATRSALAQLTPGRALAGATHADLAGSLLALPGVTVSITGAAPLGSGPDDDAIVLTLADVASALAAPSAQRLVQRTIVVLSPRSEGTDTCLGSGALDAGWGTIGEPAPWLAVTAGAERQPMPATAIRTAPSQQAAASNRARRPVQFQCC